ncbi:amino acid aminotransferase [Pelomicrobium sp. G1]|uniref:amino acid aminotransferase n=1 Tax=unclassified Pelomicrobium TaxID=2815318 RepID=UPI003F75DE6D
MRPSLFAGVPMAPRDPILGLNELFNCDKNPAKVNLGVGVYCDDTGQVPLLECVRLAERQVVEQAAPRNYLPIDGLPAYDRAAQTLLFGADSSTVADGRVVTLQALGGTGALKIGADFLRRLLPGAQVWISDPSWENHRALFEGAGFTVNAYPYYDPATHGVDFPGMMKALHDMPAQSIVVLHACCHNPTGVDLTPGQWEEVIATVRRRDLVPFLDIAYQGFGDGLDADAQAVRRFAETEGPLFVSSSFSKSFSLYGERVGALSVATSGADEAARVLSQLKRVVRTNYSNPPTHGGKIVAGVLTSPDLRALWEQELGQMRERIRTMRNQLVEKIHARVPGADFSFVARQRGMFSYSGLSREAVHRLRDEFSIYAVDTGRICVAALNSRNIDYVADAIAKVIR